MININTLLALPLALAHSEVTVNRVDLKRLASKVYWEADDEEGIQEALDSILNTNDRLKQAYNWVKTRLDTITLTANLLPSLADIKKVTPVGGQLIGRGQNDFPTGNSGLNGPEISNIVNNSLIALSESENVAKQAKIWFKPLVELLKKQPQGVTKP